MFHITFVDVSGSKSQWIEKGVWPILPSVGDRVRLHDRTLKITSRELLHTKEYTEVTLSGIKE